MGRFVVHIAFIIDGDWVQVDGWFSTPESALRYVQDTYQSWRVAARITNAETGEVFNVEGFLVDTPRQLSFREELESQFDPPGNALFPEIQEQMRGEQHRFRFTEQARNSHVERRHQRERQQTRRLRAFNFTGGANGLEIGSSNPDTVKEWKRHKKYRVEWWKEGF